ncbi:hypothetical protein C8R48DRAFT_782988 [Suillus tomentosus]|nr:hypothetical protein C8R48DRAFT_782988 [Suillus tomentosus]
MSDKSGTGSTRSLQSQGPADKKAEGTGTSRKAAAIWTKEEETSLLESLLNALSSSGDGGFKAPAFNAATLYNAVVNIKNTSGFTWSDDNGAGIALKDDDVWVRYVKHHPTAKPFRTKGFSHLALMEQLVSSQGKGKYVFQPHSTSTSATLNMNPTPSPAASTTTGFIVPQTPNHNFTTMRTPDTGLLAMGAWTSVSDTSGAKHKYSALSPESAAGSSHSKRSRPPSAMLKVQQEGAESMKDLVTVVREMQKNLALSAPQQLQPPPQQVSMAGLVQAIALLNQYANSDLFESVEEQLAIANYLADHESQAVHITWPTVVAKCDTIVSESCSVPTGSSS